MLRPTPTTFSDSIKRPRDYSSARARSVTEPLAVVLALLLCHACAWAGLQVKPGYVEVTLDKGRPAGSFLITNIGTTPERLRINAFHFNYTEQGGITQSPTGEHSLAQWLHFNPRELSLAPNTSRAVRFTIAPRGKLKPGEYWGAMEMESLNAIGSKSVEKDGKTLNIKMISAIMVPIFGTVGKVKYAGAIDEIKLSAHPKGGVAVETTLSNQGTGRLGATVNYQIHDASGQLTAEGILGKSYIFRESKRRFFQKIEEDLSPGLYTVTVSATAQHLKKPFERETQVEWTGIPAEQLPENAPGVESAPESTAPPPPQSQSPDPLAGANGSEPSPDEQ